MTKKKTAVTKTPTPAKQQDQLIELCVEIFAHADNDWEVTLCGNGTNASEASNVARQILTILGIDRKQLEPQIKRLTAKLKKQYGC